MDPGCSQFKASLLRLADVLLRSRSSAVLHVTPKLEVLGSNPDGELSRNAVILGARDSMILRAGRDAARDKG